MLSEFPEEACLEIFCGRVGESASNVIATRSGRCFILAGRRAEFIPDMREEGKKRSDILLKEASDCINTIAGLEMAWEFR